MNSIDPYKDFFLHPKSPRHCHYEILRARFVEKKKYKEIANEFGKSVYTIQSYCQSFKSDLDNGTLKAFFCKNTPGPKSDRKKSKVRERVIFLRKHGYASTDIHKALKVQGEQVSLSLIDQILRENGLIGMTKRTQLQRQKIARQIETRRIPYPDGTGILNAEIPVVADVKQLDLSDNRTLYTRLAGIFLFVPLLAKIQLQTLVEESKLIGTKMIPATSYLLSLLALKLLDKERKSHISDWNFDEAMGLFAGLNIMPKVTASSDYSYRISNQENSLLLKHWVQALYPILCPQGSLSFALDFHSIAHRGRPSDLENHYVPMRGKAQPSILSFFARAIDSPMLCYANCDLLRQQQERMPLVFIDYWKSITGMQPDWLYFDSKVATYPILEELRTLGINFITIRRRGQKMVNQLLCRPPTDWKSTRITTPKRRYSQIRYLDDNVKLKGYNALCRQIAVKDTGRQSPTLFLTNNNDLSANKIITRYTQRNSIENDIGINVNFFHMDCLGSEIRLNVNFDILLTVMANSCYRWISQKLKGCENMQPKRLYRKIIETGGHIKIDGEFININFDRRAHNPIIKQARLDQEHLQIPWIKNKKIKFSFK